ncbi:uncharacterized protein A4U43_UnF8180 [Asparagus officinalis]|uniref:Pentatricopeptide repeat-containing protein n=2 Tax=Asparagus officinalis TaxID=4686 RepID=A0A1R3L613_ASPOF|nr:uncharacterized protein A4U43_UnF8180 [Asparagus officinalis]
MPEKDIVAINAMIDGFVRFGDLDSARKLFDGMSERSVVSWTSLISGYSKVGDMEAARVLFEEMPVKNLFTWNAMIGGYCKNNQPQRALELFRELQSAACPFHPDDVTVVSILPAISSTGMIDLGRWIHRYARKSGLDKKTNVATALMDMYFKCGDIQEARRVFDSIGAKEIASWNVMINGLAVNGQATEALDVFSDMTSFGERPNEITMIGVLSACAHGGLIKEGREWFNKMNEFGIQCRINHYGCMIDLLGRGGYLDEAERLIEEMPYSPNGIILSSLLFACVCYKDIDRAEQVMKMIERVEPGNVRNYVMMRNLYAEEKRWIDVERVKEVIRSCGGKNEAGCSVIEIGRRVWEFVSGDKVHPEWEIICGILGELKLHMKGVGTDRECEIELIG